ncbi:MAG: hypothetical protein ACKOOC_00640, partial [Cyanobium sp.]
MHFEGGNPLPAFRTQALLARLQDACPRITSLSARIVHWVAFDSEPAHADVDKVAALLDYGDPAGSGDAVGELVVVMPRLGTVSPWASKATDIAHNCGLALHRIERVVEYRLATGTGQFGGGQGFDDNERAACAALLHDRMTET